MEKSEKNYYVEEDIEIEPFKLQQLVSKILKEEFDFDLSSLEKLTEGYWISYGKDIFGDSLALTSAKKHFKEITEQDMKEFSEYMHKEKARYGIFITQTFFNEKALELEKSLPIKLISGRKLLEILKETPSEEKKLEYKYDAKGSFLSGKSDTEVKDFFNKNGKRKKLFGIFGTEEKIESIEKKYSPLGSFLIKDDKKEEREILVDLNSAEVYKLKGNELKKDDFLKKIFSLPKKTQESFLSLAKKGRGVGYEKLSKEDLSILEERGFLRISEKYEKSILVSLMDEILWGIRIFTDLLGEILNMKPSAEILKSSEPAEIRKYINIKYSKNYKFSLSYNLNHFLQSSKEVSKDFIPDKINYNSDEIKNVLKNIFDREVEFNKIIYMPYYECKYIDNKEMKTRVLKYQPLKFKSFVMKEGKFVKIYNFVDKAPEIPFLILALTYALYIYPDIEKIVNVFSASLIFVFLTLFIGTLLKAIFKTEREVPYHNVPILRYGFPSLHSLTSIGTIAFVYFIPKIGPFFSLLLIPLGFLYIYSRIKLKVHTILDVIGGAIIGLILGIFSGYYLLAKEILPIPYEIKLILTILFFILPIFSILYRIKLGYLP